MMQQTNNYEETQHAGRDFAQQLHGGDVVLLYGNLGSGKTTFIQGLAKGLGIIRRIISPTFIILRSYDIPNVILENEVTPESDSGQAIVPFTGARMTVKKLYHIDLYRVGSEDDLHGLGMSEILQEKDAVIAIEWPEKLGSLMPEKYWKLSFETIAENTRRITIEKHG